MVEASVGQTLGQYRLERLLGSGATSQVFLATHMQVQRRVAIKLLAPHLLTGRDAVQRMLQEARVVNAVRHPSIIEITDFIEQSDPPVVGLVMELIEGPSLRALDGFRFSFGQAVGMGLQLVAALMATHAKGVIHRDLKPDNVLLTRDPRGDPPTRVPRIKLIDFGIAKLAGVGAETMAGQMIGTPAYMAPEQVMGSPPPSRATDVFAVGELLYELLSGRRAYPMPTIPEVTRAKQRGVKPDLVFPAAADFPALAREKLAALVGRCLETAPGDRPSLESVREVLYEVAPFPELRGDVGAVSMLPLAPETRPWLEGLSETHVGPRPSSAFDKATIPEPLDEPAIDRGAAPRTPPRGGPRLASPPSAPLGTPSSPRPPARGIPHGDTVPAELLDPPRRRDDDDEAATIMGAGAIVELDATSASLAPPTPSMTPPGPGVPVASPGVPSVGARRVAERAFETSALEALDSSQGSRGTEALEAHPRDVETSVLDAIDEPPLPSAVRAPSPAVSREPSGTVAAPDAFGYAGLAPTPHSMPGLDTVPPSDTDGSLPGATAILEAPPASLAPPAPPAPPASSASPANTPSRGAPRARAPDAPVLIDPSRRLGSVPLAGLAPSIPSDPTAVPAKPLPGLLAGAPPLGDRTASLGVAPSAASPPNARSKPVPSTGAAVLVRASVTLAFVLLGIWLYLYLRRAS